MPAVLLRALTLSIVLFSALAGCRCRPAPTAAKNPEKAPALRIALLSSAAGAIEPCGCVEDMLGGIDHASAYLRSATDAPLLVLGSGPMLFMDPVLEPDRAEQDRWKAEAMVASLKELGLRAWAPGLNDYAMGAAELARFTQGGPALVAANLSGETAGTTRAVSYSVGGVRVGVTGTSRPAHAGKSPPGVVIGDPVAELRAARVELERQGAELYVALLALPRGEALRLIEAVPGFQLALVGKAVDQGEHNDAVTPPTSIGQTLVVEAPNHLQALYVVDLFIKDGRFEFVDGSGGGEEARALESRVNELEKRIQTAAAEGAKPADISARKADLVAARAQRTALERSLETPDRSYYRARLVEVREKLGTDAKVKSNLDAYYRRVNEQNQITFKDRKPAPVPEGASGFVGAALCATCHQAEHAFWSTTRHARAYATLAKQDKQFNLDCVSCHVTGYDEPGGSTVVQVASLEHVQCETCHGAGSRHVANPADLSLIQASPPQMLCGPKCHHVPHVKPDWSVTAAWQHILGPGHGKGR